MKSSPQARSSRQKKFSASPLTGLSEPVSQSWKTDAKGQAGTPFFQTPNDLNRAAIIRFYPLIRFLSVEDKPQPKDLAGFKTPRGLLTRGKPGGNDPD